VRNISRVSWVSALLGAGVVLIGTSGAAQQDTAGAAKAPEAAAPAPPPADAPAPEQKASAKRAEPSSKPAAAAQQAVPANIPRDPAGIKGISPFWEAVRGGDLAYVAQDFEGAIKAYRSAIKHEPHNPIGHLRLGEALLRTGHSADAEAAWKTALRVAGKDPASKAKALFLLADLSERKKAYSEATERWTAYRNFANANKNVKTFPKTADDRLRRISEWEKLLKEYAAVRERITRDSAEGDKRREKSAE
jgi:tetratricopeptide (TPR) repeat protein